jgi:hypothetical protein
MKSFTATTTTVCLVWAAALSSQSSNCEAFVMTPNKTSFVTSASVTPSTLFESTSSEIGAADTVEGDDDGEEKAPANPDYPNLPEVKGDFDWDAKFGGDDDWITENVPGKVVMNEIDLAKQVTALNQLEEKYRKIRLREEYDDYQITGWVGNAELLNSRFAMFFLAVGLFTESFTGISLPGQVEEMLRILGFIGFS